MQIYWSESKLEFFQLEYLHQALTNRVRTKSSQTHQRFFTFLSFPIHRYCLVFNIFNPICFVSLYFHVYSNQFPLQTNDLHSSILVCVDMLNCSVIMIHFWGIVCRQILGSYRTLTDGISCSHCMFVFSSLSLSFWIVNLTLLHRVENPTQLRVRRWSFNCKELLSDPTGVREFMKFCKADFSTESLNFYLHVQTIRNCPLSQIKQKADFVYRLDWFFQIQLNLTVSFFFCLLENI